MSMYLVQLHCLAPCSTESVVTTLLFKGYHLAAVPGQRGAPTPSQENLENLLDGESERPWGLEQHRQRIQ